MLGKDFLSVREEFQNLIEIFTPEKENAGGISKIAHNLFSSRTNGANTRK